MAFRTGKSNRCARDLRPYLLQFFSIPCSFQEKNGQNNRLTPHLWGWHPPPSLGNSEFTSVLQDNFIIYILLISSCKSPTNQYYHLKHIKYKKYKVVFTIRVSKQERNFFLSPITMALLTTGSSLLMASSISVGATFSPPAVIRSSVKRKNVKSCET